jgi:hypothetical protein
MEIRGESATNTISAPALVPGGREAERGASSGKVVARIRTEQRQLPRSMVTLRGDSRMLTISRIKRFVRQVLERSGIAIVRHHYYTPVVFPGDILHSLSAPRRLPGINFNVDGQLALIRQFCYRDELLAIPLNKPGVCAYGYHNGSFESGDGEMLYNMIRHFKPRRVVEVGCGESTLMALLAQDRNRQDDPNYSCRHICVEPFENPWLANVAVELIRERIERVDSQLIESLDKNDILFIDSSHVIRPQGDVVHEYLLLLGVLRPGVIVHVHDAFTPRDYPESWVLEFRRLWNEQYLLEAFLSFNDEFEVLSMVNYLAHDHLEALENACPILVKEPGREPGSFWFRRRLTM